MRLPCHLIRRRARARSPKNGEHRLRRVRRITRHDEEVAIHPRVRRRVRLDASTNPPHQHDTYIRCELGSANALRVMVARTYVYCVAPASSVLIPSVYSAFRLGPKRIRVTDSPDSDNPDGREVPVDIPSEWEDSVREEYPRVAKDSIVCIRKEHRDSLAGLCICQVSTG